MMVTVTIAPAVRMSSTPMLLTMRIDAAEPAMILGAPLGKEPATPCTSPGHDAEHWPRHPRAGGARRARHGGTPCVAGVGFAGHRLAHRAVQSRPHQCGQRRRRYRRCAAHDPVQHPLHSRPLKCRGGSDEPLSPAPISRTSMLLDWPSRTARGGLGFHTPRTDGALPASARRRMNRRKSP